MLRLLTHPHYLDRTGAVSSTVHGNYGVADVVFFGVNILIPNVSVEMLKVGINLPIFITIRCPHGSS